MSGKTREPNVSCSAWVAAGHAIALLVATEDTHGAAEHQPDDLCQITDPLGHVTSYASYDTDGRPTRITDANGIDLTYTPRGWLASHSVGGATTTFAYAAHRLVKVIDAQGNYVQHTLDAAGGKIAEQVANRSGTVHQSLSHTFNVLGKLSTVVDGLNRKVFNASDAHTYAAANNVLTATDTTGIVATQTHTYHAQNRRLSASHPDSTQNIGYHYDEANSITGCSTILFLVDWHQ